MGISLTSVAFAGVAVTLATLFAIGTPAERAAREAAAPARAPVKPAEPAPVPAAWVVPDVDKLPDDEAGRTVRAGRDLTTRTAQLLGPETPDAAHRYAGNNLACASCHLDAGTKRFGIPYIGVYNDFPSYRARSGAVGTIEGRVNGCMTRSMNGRALPLDSPEMQAVVSYIKFLSTGQPAGQATPGRGSGAMPELARPADPGRGQAVYDQNCASCHQPDGLGQRAGTPGDGQGYTFPPLWGPDSFNDGAGMDRLIAAANFIHSNMPNGVSWDQPALSPDDAWDVAAFVQAQPRPEKAHLDRDYPDRLQKPVDAGYGPYADGFDPAVHKLGPFAPIREAIAKLAASAPGAPINQNTK